MAETIYFDEPHLRDLIIQRDAGMQFTLRFNVSLTGTVLFTVRDEPLQQGNELLHLSESTFTTNTIANDQVSFVVPASDLPPPGTYYYAVQHQLSAELVPVHMKGEFRIQGHAGRPN